MYKPSTLGFVICCVVVLAVVSAYPSYPAGAFVAVDQESAVPVRVVREAAADPQRGRGHGFRRRGHGGHRGFVRPGGFGGANSQANSQSSSFSQSFSSPLGSFSASASQSSASSSAGGFRGKRQIPQQSAREAAIVNV